MIGINASLFNIRVFCAMEIMTKVFPKLLYGFVLFFQYSPPTPSLTPRTVSFHDVRTRLPDLLLLLTTVHILS